MKQYTVVAILIILATLALYHYQPTTTTASLEVANQSFIDYLTPMLNVQKQDKLCALSISKKQ